jgi:hypothetical protein
MHPMLQLLQAIARPREWMSSLHQVIRSSGHQVDIAQQTMAAAAPPPTDMAHWKASLLAPPMASGLQWLWASLTSQL